MAIRHCTCEPGDDMNAPKRFSFLAAGLAICACGVIWTIHLLASAAPIRDVRGPAVGSSMHGFAGTPPCSGRACHGGEEPKKDAIAQQNEYTTFVLHDKHAQAYQALLSDRAKKMAQNLAPTNPDGKPIDAHLDQRCLACHVTPQAAWDRPNEKPDLIVENWRQGGVSCEACHGPASGPKPWLTEHTAPEKWRNRRLTLADKESYGFYDLSDPK